MFALHVSSQSFIPKNYIYTRKGLISANCTDAKVFDRLNCFKGEPLSKTFIAHCCINTVGVYLGKSFGKSLSK